MAPGRRRSYRRSQTALAPAQDPAQRSSAKEPLPHTASAVTRRSAGLYPHLPAHIERPGITEPLGIWGFPR
jgi:hypothetical protein